MWVFDPWSKTHEDLRKELRVGPRWTVKLAREEGIISEVDEEISEMENI